MISSVLERERTAWEEPAYAGEDLPGDLTAGVQIWTSVCRLDCWPGLPVESMPCARICQDLMTASVLRDSVETPLWAAGSVLERNVAALLLLSLSMANVSCQDAEVTMTATVLLSACRSQAVSATAPARQDTTATPTTTASAWTSTSACPSSPGPARQEPSVPIHLAASPASALKDRPEMLSLESVLQLELLATLEHLVERTKDVLLDPVSAHRLSTLTTWTATGARVPATGSAAA